MKGTFEGTVELSQEFLIIKGRANYEFTDKFEDPLSLGFEVFGDPYNITGSWSSDLEAKVLKDSTKSEYK